MIKNRKRPFVRIQTINDLQIFIFWLTVILFAAMMYFLIESA
jgi:hypothetical protein